MSVFNRYVEIVKIWYPFLTNKDGEAQTIVNSFIFSWLDKADSNRSVEDNF